MSIHNDTPNGVCQPPIVMGTPMHHGRAVRVICPHCRKHHTWPTLGRMSFVTYCGKKRSMPELRVMVVDPDTIDYLTDLVS